MVASARLVAVEQGLALVELADRARGRVEAQRQLVAVRAAAAPAGTDSGACRPGCRCVGSSELAVLVEEDVDALVEAHQRQRHRIVADREDDRIVALEQRELVDRDRDRVGRARSSARFSIGRIFILPCWVDVQRLERIVEQAAGSGVGAAVAIRSVSQGAGYPGLGAQRRHPAGEICAASLYSGHACLGKPRARRRARACPVLRRINSLIVQRRGCEAARPRVRRTDDRSRSSSRCCRLLLGSRRLPERRAAAGRPRLVVEDEVILRVPVRPRPVAPGSNGTRRRGRNASRPRHIRGASCRAANTSTSCCPTAAGPRPARRRLPGARLLRRLLPEARGRAGLRAARRSPLADGRKLQDRALPPARAQAQATEHSLTIWLARR